MLGNRAGFLFRRGFVPSQVNVRDWLDPEPLRRALALRTRESEKAP